MVRSVVSKTTLDMISFASVIFKPSGDAFKARAPLAIAAPGWQHTWLTAAKSLYLLRFLIALEHPLRHAG